MQWDAQREEEKEIENTEGVSNENKIVKDENKPTDFEEKEEKEIDSNETEGMTVTTQQTLAIKIEEDNTSNDTSSSQAMNVSLPIVNQNVFIF